MGQRATGRFPSTRLRIAVEVGEIELSGTGDYGLDIGDVKLSKGTIRITAKGKGQGTVELLIGDAQVSTLSGGNIDLVVGQVVDLSMEDIEVKTINRALTGETTPQLATAFNALAIDPTALDEIAALFGMRLCPVMSCPADDADTVARMAGIVSEWVRLGHGRDHRDTCRLADLARDILPALMALVFEADSVRGRA